MIRTAGLAILAATALLGQSSRTYYWRDAAGQTHITNTPPPPGAESLDPPPPLAVELGKPGARRDEAQGARLPVALDPVQKQAWAALDAHLAKARAAGDRHTVEAVADSLIQDCLWGQGLWAMPALPVLALALLGLMGWWLALGLPAPVRLATTSGFFVLGLAFGHLLLTTFLYHPQALRLRQNLELLESHTGAGRPLRSEGHARLQQRYLALEAAAGPTQAPWRFPGEVQALRDTVKQVMVEP